MNKTYKIIYYSAWVSPQIFFTNSINELDEIVFEGRQAQYKVEVEEC
tara:strand:- start:1117 stop:1257 length:141 start_codon:yes stop_codon:yes gene_type:complete